MTVCVCVRYARFRFFAYRYTNLLLQLSPFRIVAGYHFLTLDITQGLFPPDNLLKTMYSMADINNHIHSYLNIVDMNFLSEGTEKHK